ncbi:hypothetical protein C8R47DRAFT_998968 [Mycena vitilis]|nr:hypothetical protein C8R47DRAFT_998968 [Mycena vitilis]
MSHLEHADDMAIVSYSPAGLQRHLKTFGHWCGNNLLEANASKSWVMVFGPVPATLPRFTLNEHLVRYTDCFCYVGVTFQSTHRNIFKSHYIAKASKARKSGFAVLGIESFIGELPPKDSRLLYMGCVDSHLTSGADIIIDIDDGALAHLEKVQTGFLRRLLGLGPYSIRAPLFTELGLVPIRYRRLILAIRYLGYLISLPPAHYARAALEDSFLLFCEGKQGYWMDLHCALRNLPFPITLPPRTALTLESCTALGKAVYTSAMKFLDSKVENSARLYLLHDRREPLEDEPPRKITVVLRHYLDLVVNAKHRKALTRLLVSQHPLAVERMRYKQRYHREDVPRHCRLCRFGCGVVETVEHALFFCTGTVELAECRGMFIDTVRDMEPRVLTVTPLNGTEILRALVFRRDTVCQIAKLAHKIFAIFKEEPMVWPVGV